MGQIGFAAAQGFDFRALQYKPRFKRIDDFIIAPCPTVFNDGRITGR